MIPTDYRLNEYRLNSLWTVGAICRAMYLNTRQLRVYGCE